jgi:uncharacterized damage-inducible protein DinB
MFEASGPKFPNMKDQLIEAWQTNNKMNLLFIDEVNDEGMQKTLSTRGGRTIYEQLVHVHNVRMTWLEIVAKEIFKKYKALEKNVPYNKKLLRKTLEESAEAIRELIELSWEQGGKLKGYKKGLIPFIAYLIAHEGHHRGNAMLTLKQSGIKVSDKLKWGLWEWDK